MIKESINEVIKEKEKFLKLIVEHGKIRKKLQQCYKNLRKIDYEMPKIPFLEC